MHAPIVMFVYNRPEHTKKSLEALMNNNIAKESDLFIFSDGPKNRAVVNQVSAVRDYIRSEFIKNKFRNVEVFESELNKGLANSIISGVTKIINEYGKVIVIEDDCIASKDFLEFMNDNLNFFSYNQNIWSIGGYSFITNFPEDYKESIFLMGRTCSYAWATWLDRWEKVDWQVSDYSKFKYDFHTRKLFDYYGNDRSLMLDAQMNSYIDSWAIRFCYSMFKNNMYTVLPRYTKIVNIGRDGSGTHAKKVSHNFDVKFSAVECETKLRDVDIDERLRKEFIKKYNLPFMFRAKKYLEFVILKNMHKKGRNE